MDETTITVIAAQLTNIQARLAKLEAQESTATSIAASSKTLIKRDTNGAAEMLGAMLPRSSSGVGYFGIDCTSTGSAVTLANNVGATLFGANHVFSGLVLISETAADGSMALFITGRGAAFVISDPYGQYSATGGNAGTSNLYVDGSLGVVMENKRGASRTYNIFAIRVRNSQ